MTITIVDSKTSIPNSIQNGYQPKSIHEDVTYNGVIYSKRILFEKKIDIIHRLGIAIVAFITTITVIPLLIKPSLVLTYWKQAIYGVDQKVVFIRLDGMQNIDVKEIKDKKQEDHLKVHFGEVRGRFFHKDQPPAEIHDLNSVVLGKINTDSNACSFVQSRKIPPLSIVDTFIATSSGIKSAHGKGELFSDHEIVEKLPIVRRQLIGDKVYAEFTKYGKAIIQQQATRGCTAATSAMLIVDNGKQPKISNLKMRNLGDDANQIKDMKEAGLKPVINTANTLLELRKLILKHGSAIVSVNNKLGAHVIVADDISANLSRIRLRDPYHGWEITVTKEAFLKEWSGGKAIQILKS